MVDRGCGRDDADCPVLPAHRLYSRHRLLPCTISALQSQSTSLMITDVASRYRVSILRTLWIGISQFDDVRVGRDGLVVWKTCEGPAD